MSILFTVHQEYASIWNNRRQQKFLHANKNKHDILEFDIRKSCWEFIYYQYPYIISVKNIHELFIVLLVAHCHLLVRFRFQVRQVTKNKDNLISRQSHRALNRKTIYIDRNIY